MQVQNSKRAKQFLVVGSSARVYLNIEFSHSLALCSARFRIACRLRGTCRPSRPLELPIESREQSLIALYAQATRGDSRLQRETPIHQEDERLRVTAEGDMSHHCPPRLDVTLAVFHYDIVWAGDYPCHVPAVANGAGQTGTTANVSHPRE